MSYDDTDPLAGGNSHPAISWRDKPVGTTVAGRIVEAPKMVQSRDFETGEPATWPDGNPKMSVVTVLEVNGEEAGLWAPKPSAMFAALAAAQQRAGARMAPGGTLTVTLTGEEPNKNPRLNPRKLFTASYAPADVFATAPAPQVETRQTALTQAAALAPADNPIAALAALKEKIAPLIAAGLQPAQIAAVPGIVGPDGAPLTPELVSTILALP